MISSGRVAQVTMTTRKALEADPSFAFDIADYNKYKPIDGLDSFDIVIHAAYLQDSNGTSSTHFLNNFFASISLIESWAEARTLRSQGGTFIFVSSESTRFGLKANPLYPCCKAAIHTFMKSCQNKYSKTDLRFNTVSPGYISDVGMASHSYENDDVRERRSQMTVAARWTTSSEVANIIAYLALEGSSYIIGQDILIDGGKSILEQS